ncbi:hypothetical protein PTRA_b0021 [Pseudoalteromonas translucida KMM 520]|uniref:Uncharacterized protein n=1 Tax=Pseudoalteromonas translucida KMM 520 TaxID=1315283 RepID=A0A0U2VME6_9GAMM|nr:hypothetical protein PTRA_b0021 [Pseudoalteromonas translucida KMM 520]
MSANKNSKLFFILVKAIKLACNNLLIIERCKATHYYSAALFLYQ